MAPDRANSRPPRRRVRPTLRPFHEDLETRVVPTNLGGVSSVLPPISIPTGTIAPLATVNPDAGSNSPGGYSPQQIRAAYGFDRITFGSVAGDGAGQTIAIVDAYDHPGLIDSSAAGFSTSDLAQFDRQFGLPDPPSFTKLNQEGKTSPMPGTDPSGPGNPSGNWEYEEAMDVEWAHALAPAASIVLVEANSSDTGDLYAAISIANHLAGVSVVSLSWGGSESSSESNWDQNFQTPSGHQGVTFVAASGDAGAPGIYPAYSPNVVAVGGTSAQISGQGSIQSETAWSGSGGGVSTAEPEPSYQQGVQNTGSRTIPDVSFDAASNSGVSVYDSYDNTGGGPWITEWGTSLAAPSWAALIAVADQGRILAGGTTLDGPSQTLPALYSLPSSDFHDITGGSNGSYSAGTGYDEVTGLGTPLANLLAPDLAFYGMTDHLVIEAQPGSSMTAGQPFGLTVELERPDGTLDSAASGTLAISLATHPGGAGLGGTLAAQIDHGVATFSGLAIDQAGAGYSLSVGGSGFGSVTSSTFSVTPAAASQLVVAAQPPSSLAAGTSFGLTLNAEDAYGNLVSGFSGDVTLALAGGAAGASLGGALAAPFNGGVATFSGLSIDQAGTGYTIAASAPGPSTATTGSFQVAPAAPAQLVITSQPPSSVTAGMGFGLTVSVEDQFGNLESGFGGSLAVSLVNGSAGSTLGGPTAATAQGGVATFSGLELTSAGSSYELAVGATGLGSVTSTAFSVTPAAASQIVIAAQPPTSTTAGSGFGLTADVEDAFGNLVTGYSGRLKLALTGGPAGGSLLGGLEAGVSGGIASFSGLSIDQAGDGYLIDATATGLTTATTSSFQVVPAGAAQLVIATGPPSTVTAGAAFGMTVSVEDPYGNLETGYQGDVTASLSTGPDGAAFGGPTTVPADGGVATFSGLELTSTGSTYQITASGAGLTNAETGPLAVTPASPARLVITHQPPSSVTAGTGFGLDVSVEDAFGNPVTGYDGDVTVALEGGPSGSSLSGTASKAASKGTAAFSGLAIDQAGGGYVLQVSASGLGGLSTTPFRVVPAAPSRLVIVHQPPSPITAGQSFGFTVAVEDDYGNMATGFNNAVTATLASHPSGGTLSGPVTANASGGLVTFSGLVLDRAGGDYAVQATSGGLSSAASTAITVAPASPSRLVITTQPAGSVGARRPFAIGVEAVDAFGNVATGFDGTVTAVLGSNARRDRLRGTLAVQAKAGEAVISDATLRKAGKSYAVTITSNGLTPAATSVFRVTKSAGGSAAAVRRASRFGLRGPGHPASRSHATTHRQGPAS